MYLGFLHFTTEYRKYLGFSTSLHRKYFSHTQYPVLLSLCISYHSSYVRDCLRVYTYCTSATLLTHNIHYSPNEIQESCHLTPLSPGRGEKNCKSSVGVAYFLVIYFTHICSVKVFSLRKITQNVSLCKITQNGTFMRAVQRTL